MKVKELKSRLERMMEEDEIVVLLDSPSVGQAANCKIAGIYRGTDWERGLVLLKPVSSLVIKTHNERLWDEAQALIYFLAGQRTHKGNKTDLAKEAEAILQLVDKQEQERR